MKRVGILLAVLLVLVLAVAVALPFLIDANRFRPILEAKLSAAIARNVKIGSLELAILSGGVTARDVSISDDATFSHDPFVHADSLQVGVELKPLIFSRQLNITGITIEQPDVRLVQTLAGKWNYSTLGLAAAAGATPPESISAQASAANQLRVALFRVNSGRITLSIPGGQTAPMVLDKVNLEMKGISTTEAIPFTLSANLPSGSTVTASGTAGPLSQADAAATPFEAVIHAAQVDLLKSGLMNAETGITGLATLDANISGKGDATQIKGKLKLEQLKLVRTGTPAKKPVDIDFALTSNRKQQAGDLTELGIRFGTAEASLTGHYDLRGKTPAIHMKLAGPKLDITELANMLPAMDVVLPSGASVERGTAAVAMTLDGPLDDLVTAGTLSATDTRLANYDLGTKLKVLGTLAGIKVAPHTDIQSLTTSIRLSNEGTSLSALHLVVPSIGDLTGDGTVSPTHALNFKMRLTVTKVAGFVPTGGAFGAIPFTIQGTSDNPVFRPDVKSLATDKLRDLTGGATSAKDLLNGLFGKKPVKK